MIHDQTPDEGAREREADEPAEDARAEDDGVETEGDEWIDEDGEGDAEEHLHLCLGLVLVLREAGAHAGHEVDGNVDDEGEGEEGQANEGRQDVAREDPEGREAGGDRDRTRGVERRRERNLRQRRVGQTRGRQVGVVGEERLLESRDGRGRVRIGEKVDEAGSRAKGSASDSEQSAVVRGLTSERPRRSFPFAGPSRLPRAARVP